MNDNELIELVLEFVEEFEYFNESFKKLLVCKTPNFLKLQRNKFYTKVIEKYRNTRRKAVPLVKGYNLSKSFKRWILDNYKQSFNVFIEMDKNYEILRYIVYTLLFESNKPNKNRKYIKDIADFIGVGISTITKTGILLENLNIIDYTSKFGHKNIRLGKIRTIKRNTGLIDHQAFNNLITSYLIKEWGIRYYSNPYIFKPISLEHPDGLIILKKTNFCFQSQFRKTYYKKDPTLVSFKGFDYIIIDFTSLTSSNNISDKISKYYPPFNVLLLIVGLDINHDIKRYSKKSNIPFNAKVISTEFLARLIQLDDPKYKKYKKIFGNIVYAAHNCDIKKLSELVNDSEVKLFTTEDLLKDLRVMNLSKVFHITNKYEIFLKKYIKLVNRSIHYLIQILDLDPKIESLAKKIIYIAYKNKKISLSFDHIGYVAASVYAASKFLLNKALTYEILTNKLRITGTPLSERLNEFKNEPKILFNILYNALIEEIFKNLEISDENIKILTFKIIKVVYKKVAKSIDNAIAIGIVSIYLSLNKFGKRISRRKICEVLNFDRNVLNSMINSFSPFKIELKKLGINIKNPEKSSVKRRIINLLTNQGPLTTKNIMRLMQFDCRRYLSDLLNEGSIEKEIKFVGRTKMAFWKLKGAKVNVNLYDSLRKEILSIFKKRDELTTVEISEILNLDSQKIYKYLTKLKEKEVLRKIIKREGNTSRAYWILK
ncbi:MAG: winged helix-turn-helix transcriptional regulator [Promethearchaeota archaeon]|nr:MAG: winged helix-turn-helix transcriptional regulator [Candidatus Lokiarchaeota archaeon]